MTKVFVYGTLKQGYGNSYLLRHARFIGTGQTQALCRLLDAGFPVLRPRIADRQSSSHVPVRGEVYECNTATMQKLDALEGEGKMYHRRTKYIDMDNGKRVKAFAYVGDGNFWRHRALPYYPANDVNYEWPHDKKYDGTY